MFGLQLPHCGVYHNHCKVACQSTQTEYWVWESRDIKRLITAGNVIKIRGLLMQCRMPWFCFSDCSGGIRLIRPTGHWRWMLEAREADPGRVSRLKRLKVKGRHLYTATYMNMTSSGLQCEVAYWPAMTLGGAAQVAAAHCPNERTLDPAVCSYNRPTYTPASRTMAFTPQCSRHRLAILVTSITRY